jgi:hypothetical protein
VTTAAAEPQTTTQDFARRLRAAREARGKSERDACTARAALEAAFLRVLRARHGQRVHPLRDNPNPIGERATSARDDDRVKTSA